MNFPAKHLKILECLCVKKVDTEASSTSSISAKATCVPATLKATVSGSSSISATITRARSHSLTITGFGDVNSKLSARVSSFNSSLSGDGNISEGMTAQYSLKQTVENEGSISSNLNKIVGNFDDFKCVEKLYPSGDLAIDLNMGDFRGPLRESGNLYTFIDEGVFVGDYDSPFGDGVSMSDDDNSYIQPDTLHTSGEFQYKCNLTNFLVRPDNTSFRIRASAPLTNLESQVAPRYTIYDIKFKDPHGNLIVQYEDIIFRGDCDHDTNPLLSFTTFASAPKTNKVTEFYDWERDSGVPSLREKTGYNLTFNVKVEALDDPFDEGFNTGFEEYAIDNVSYASGSDYLALDGSPLSTQSQGIINPTNNIRISAIEICNSGAYPLGQGYGPRIENYLSFYTEVPSVGRRLEKKISPSFVPVYDFDTGVWPAASSIWSANNTTAFNLDECGSDHILENIQDSSTSKFITLNNVASVHPDSGKLTLKFSHGFDEVSEVTRGAFNCAFDQNTCDMWFHPSGSFDTENKTKLREELSFFDVESITLKVTAKKAAGTNDYPLDVVGYSDDKILNSTKAPSGFLQNPANVQINNVLFHSEGVHPYVSGFNFVSDDLSLAGTSLSERDDHFETSGNLGGDHYSLSTYPKVTTTDFAEYEVPLKIYDDNVQLGRSRDYSVSSLFEDLYLDICPLPSGASIANIHLLVRYKPQNAFNLMTQGGEKYGHIDDYRSEASIFPSSGMHVGDEMLNAGSGYGSISYISGIPHAYTTPSSIKSNYARRWKGMQGIIRGPYDPNMFGFGFENPQVDFPFLFGYWDFTKINTSPSTPLFISRNPTILGAAGSPSVSEVFLRNGDLGQDLYKNIGWRFIHNSGIGDCNIFDKYLPGYSGAYGDSYKTSDWTSLSSGSKNFKNDPLYGKIADAFDTVVRVSGQGGNRYIEIQETEGELNASGGFSVFLRFIPDANASGLGYNGFNSGVLVSKWESPGYQANLDFALGYKNGFLCGYAQDKDKNIVTVQDTMPYSGYQYPLSVLLTYNDHHSSGLKLYTDNELHTGAWTTLRAQSGPFHKWSPSMAGMSNSDINVGWSRGSGVGFNMLVSDIGVSTYSSGTHTLYGSGTNIVETGPDLKYKQVTAQSFLEGHRSKFFQPLESVANDSYKLWDYVNENTYTDWSLGDFKHSPFNYEFASLGSTVGKRTGRDVVNFHLRHSGEAYSTKSDLTMPTGVDSGVAYHTQIENDFLRFHLTDAASNFHAVRSRITKNLPEGYKFSDRALVVETVLDYETSGSMIWDKCLPTTSMICSEHTHSPTGQGIVGPKLIVSLYTKTQHPEYRTPDESNWGLINRDTHYLAESGSITKLSSKFTYEDLIDTSEGWSIFPTEPRTQEFFEKYFSQDVNDMFLQYDLVFPSGPQFESTINIHSAHVRAEDAIVSATENSGNMNIFTSGGNTLNYQLNMFAFSAPTGASGEFNLYTEGPFLVESSGFNLFSSGTVRVDENLNLYLHNYVPFSGDMNLFASGDVWNQGSGSFNLSLPVVSESLTVNYVPLTLYNSSSSFVPSGGSLDLFTYAAQGNVASGTTGIYTYPLNMNIKGVGIPIGAPGEEIAPLNIFGSTIPENRFPSANMTLFINTPTDFSVSMPLFIVNEGLVTTIDPTTGLIKGLNLFAANYGGAGSDYLMWYNENYGESIALEDNKLFKIPTSNEIRGVDLIGYGSCTGNSPSKAIDPPLITDETIWKPETCEDGGIFRAKATYTNSGALYFDNTTYGYSGNYYGIRKFTGLSPQEPYDVEIKITTGHTDPIPVPRTLEDWEYGICGPDWHESGCCTTDCDQNLVYSGVKLLGDFPFLSGNADITPPSGRNEEDHYGRSVGVSENLMAVASTMIEIPSTDTYTSNPIEVSGAGAVFLYRRGEDVAGKKASWQMEDKLMLPYDYRKDFISHTIPKMITYEDDFFIDGKQWAIGQEGRRMGSSLDLCSSGDRETVVLGAPYADWTRPFDDIETSGIPVGMIVFTDAFSYKREKVGSVAAASRKWDILYKYFSAPWYAGTPNQFQPRIDIKLVIFQLVTHEDERPDVDHDHDFFNHAYINRMDDEEVKDSMGAQNLYDSILQTVSGTFLNMFRSPTAGPHSGIPPILGIFREKSNSAGLGAFQHPTDENRNIVEDFKDWYNTYSYQNGVIDPTVPEAENGYVNTVLGPSEDWKQTSIDLLNETLATGNLIGHDALDFITSGVGQKWAKEGAYEFNIPPSSGGRVYIFEKESGVFNCVQEIKSYADRHDRFDGFGGDGPGPGGGVDGAPGLGIQYNDRYGHSVAISKNSEVISIGSPFTHVPCEIYERDEHSSGHLYNHVRDYLVHISDTVALARYDELFPVSGLLGAARQSYHEMSHNNKFGIRNKYDVELYKPVFDYKYRDIPSTGTWQFILGEFLGTSRLGYSTSVNDDGSVVAFGAPTDSMNLFEDSNIWYKGRNYWSSYTNAGAVRLFESKKIYPHNSVVEFTRFGNLDRTMHEDLVSKGYYDQMGLYFQPSKIPFSRTDFETLEIPQDAGLAFVITPEIDSASDEVIDNIKNWLALGDRTLVLVGNDPVYEDNGLYKESNDIVNKVLKKLGSRMRIHPADTKYEALLGDGNLYQEADGCVNETNAIQKRFNVTEAFLPAYAHPRFKESPLYRGDMFAKGVGDIRIDLSDVNLENYMQLAPCDDLNQEKCSLPIKHNGDLRATWSSECTRTAGQGERMVRYQTSWGFHFDNPNPAQTCDNYPANPAPVIPKPYEDPAAVLTAAEWTPDEIIIIPEKTGERCRKIPCFKFIDYEEDTVVYSFAETQHSEVAFNLFEDSDSNATGIFNSFDLGHYVDPEKKNGRDSLLQGQANLTGGTPIKVKNIVSDDSILALQESYFKRQEDNSLLKTTSKAIMMASLLGENTRSMGATGDDEFPSNNGDQNVLFFVNMIKKDCELAPAVLQLGGFTGRTSFREAYAPNGAEDLKATNILKTRLRAYGVTVQENVTFESDHEDIPARYLDQDVTTIWIANPIGKPSDADVSRIRRFLDQGDKKIVITYSATEDDTRQIIAENVDYLCGELDIKSRPMFMPTLGEYFLQTTETVVDGNTQDYPFREDEERIQIVNPNVDSTIGCADGYGWYDAHTIEPVDTKVDKIALWPFKYDTGSIFDTKPEDYIPISGGHGSDFERIISYADQIVEEVIVVPDEYEFDHSAVVQFPVVPRNDDPTSENYFPSGYRFFLNWISETLNDHYEIDVEIGPAIFDPNTFGDIGSDGFLKLEKTTPRFFGNATLDLIATQNYLDIKITSTAEDILPEEEKEAGRGLPPLTTRIYSMSGCRLDIESEIITEKKTKKVPCDPPFTIECTPWKQEEQIIIVPGEFRPIKHPSREYCSTDKCTEAMGDFLIEDGPVIVAEEFEHFSAGTNGNERSKIVVISDSTLLQGQCPHYRNEALTENQRFIRSLYPKSPSFPEDYDGGRLFEFKQKLRAPERGSPGKYLSVSGISNTIPNKVWGYNGVSKALSNYTDQEDNYDPALPGFLREADPVDPTALQDQIKFFGTGVAPEWGHYPRFSGDFLGIGTYHTRDGIRDYLVDAGRAGGTPELMKFNGTDYLDFDIYRSGCVGDLFGYSVDLTQDKLVVGTPFNGFDTYSAVSGVSGIVQWHEIQNTQPSKSGIELSENGGAGSVFYYNRTGSGRNFIAEKLPWEFKQKIKPSSINVGLVNPLIAELSKRGDHNLDSDFIHDYARMGDMFGYSVAIDADMVAIGAPNHDFESIHQHVYAEGEFVRKEFTAAFDIPDHNIYDLGSSGVRTDLFSNNSGTMVLNNGAVFNYRHEMTDFSARTKTWVYGEKLYPQGHKDRTAANKFIAALSSGCENDHFGWSVALHRSKRGDSDYTLVAGAPFHDFPGSGLHVDPSPPACTSGLADAGAAYTFDAMLREQTPSIPAEGGWIDLEVFGDRGSTPLQTRVYQNTTGGPTTYYISGLLFPTANGDIFLEASGFDPAIKGFVAHRPYIESVIGTRVTGVKTFNGMTLNTFGQPIQIDNAWPQLAVNQTNEFEQSFNASYDSLSQRPSGMSLFIPGPSSDIVYNNVNMFVNGALGVPSGTMNLVASSSGISGVSTLNMNIGASLPTGSLPINIRGFK